MSNESMYYMIKPGDSLESISKKTGIPLNALWNMKSKYLGNINEINPGDQIVWKDGVAIYENHLYGPLSQKPSPPPDNTTGGKSSSSDSSSDDSSTNSDENKGSNSPTKSCEVCNPEDGECLCEVEIVDVQPDIGYFLKSTAKLKEEKNKRLKDQILFCSVKKADEKPNDKKISLDIRYKVLGECVNNNEDKGCVSVYIKEYSDLVPKEPIEASELSKDIGPSYNKLIEPIVEGSDVYHKTSEECASYKEYKRPYNPGKNVLVTTDGEKITDLVKPSALNPFYFFMRGFNFLVQGRLNHFPANIYRFGVLTCNEDLETVGTKHYTDLIVLPSYKVSFTGSLEFSRSFTGVSKQTTAAVEVEFKEEVNGKGGDSIKFSYATMREEFAGSPPPSNAGFGNKFLNQMFKIGDFLNKVEGVGQGIGDRAQGALELATGGGSGRPRLFTIDPMTPKIVIGADASLWFDSNKNIEVNRLRSIKEEKKEFENPEKPVSVNGTVNVPSAKDQPNRDAYNAKIESDIQKYNESYLRFDPLVGGVFAINLIQLIGRIPAAAAVIGTLSALDCDIFNKIRGGALVWDKGKDARDKLLAESNGRMLRVQAYMFCSCDISFSPGVLFHNAEPNKLGASFDLRGSFGAGFSAGAVGELKVAIISLKGQIQGSYGIRIYFSIDYATGLTKFWHDGIGGDAEVSSTKKADINTGRGGSDDWGLEAKSGNVSVGNGKNGINASVDLSGKEAITDGGWRDSKYDPAIDNPYDDPIIKVPFVFEDPPPWKFWTSRQEPVKGSPTMLLPNPVSRYVRGNDLPSKAQLLEGFKRQIGGTEAERTAYANRLYEEYEKMIEERQSAKKSSESGYWIPPTSFANPSFTFNAYKPPANEVKAK